MDDAKMWNTKWCVKTATLSIYCYHRRAAAGSVQHRSRCAGLSAEKTGGAGGRLRCRRRCRYRRLQSDLFGEFNLESSAVTQARLQVVDNLNKRYGKGTLHFAAEDLSRAWEPKHDLRSPRYTSDWQELPIAIIK